MIFQNSVYKQYTTKNRSYIQAVPNLYRSGFTNYISTDNKKKNMNRLFLSRYILIFHAAIMICCSSFANENLFRQARALQRDGKFDEAIAAFKDYLSQPMERDS